MKALVYSGPGRISWTEVPDPVVLHSSDVIVRVDTTTICGTDLHILKGDVPACKTGEFWAMKESAQSSNWVQQSATSWWATVSSSRALSHAATAPTAEPAYTPTALGTKGNLALAGSSATSSMGPRQSMSACPMRTIPCTSCLPTSATIKGSCFQTSCRQDLK